MILPSSRFSRQGGSTHHTRFDPERSLVSFGVETQGGRNPPPPPPRLLYWRRGQNMG